MRDRELSEALGTLGVLLRDRGLSYQIVVIGGSALLLLGLVARPTRDLDVLAVVDGERYLPAAPLPEPLREAAEDVGALLGLGPHWLNPGPTSLLELGLPPGFPTRLITRRYAGLTVHVAGRFDLVCFKLYALVDQGPGTRHEDDLRALEPTDDELIAAARWTRTHDPSPSFRSGLLAALAHLGVTDADAKL